MLFHLFVFSSHMNCSIHSHSAGKLIIRMIYMCTLSYITLIGNHAMFSKKLCHKSYK